MQMDFSMPERLGAEYVAEDGSKKVPVMLHRAILGSIERFLGILIEQHAGAFPAWLAPQQVVVATIVTDANDYAEEVLTALRNAGLRAEADLRNEKIGYKVREHSLQKIPAILCIGKREAEQASVAVRRFGSKAQTVMPLEQFIEHFSDEVAQKKVFEPNDSNT